MGCWGCQGEGGCARKGKGAKTCSRPSNQPTHLVHGQTASSPWRHGQFHTQQHPQPGHMQLRGCLGTAWQPEGGSLPLLWQLWLDALPLGMLGIHCQACDPASHSCNIQAPCACINCQLHTLLKQSPRYASAVSNTWL